MLSGYSPDTAEREKKRELLFDVFENRKGLECCSSTKPSLSHTMLLALAGPDGSPAAARVNLNVSNCSAANGAYEGLAGLLSTLSTNDTLEFALSDPSFAEVNGITRF